MVDLEKVFWQAVDLVHKVDEAATTHEIILSDEQLFQLVFPIAVQELIKQEEHANTNPAA